MTKAVMLMAVLVAVLSAAACGGSGTQPSDSGLETLQGEEFRLADKRGEVVALYFMAGY